MKALIAKIGNIPFPSKEISWAKNSLLQPTPILINNDLVRIYCGMRDSKGMSRIGYVDINPKDPTKLIGLSKEPCLDLGDIGHFDESGVVPCAITKLNNKLALFYAGYQLGKTVRFFAYSGLAFSEDGKIFKRYKKTPVLERSDEEMIFRVIHTILPEKNGWRVWYGAGNSFIEGTKKTLPNYNIYTMYSEDAINYPTKGTIALKTNNEEYRVGRPFVFKQNEGFLMLYGYGSERDPYKIGLAKSEDGKIWKRIDKSINFKDGFDGWDSNMQAYPSLVEVNEKLLFFYNGNNYGYDGICCAMLSFQE